MPKIASFIVANFKSHQARAEAEAWRDKFTAIYKPRVGEVAVILTPSFSNLYIYENVQHTLLGAQDVSPFPPGNYTGAVNARQLKDFGVEYCIVGHSERRRWFGETNQMVALKCRELLEAGIIPILCLDLDYAQAQMAALEIDDQSPLVVAYEPVESIGTGNPQPTNLVSEALGKLPSLVGNFPILYGGSVTSQNAADYLSVPGISGLLVGGASLSAHEFANIINQA